MANFKPKLDQALKGEPFSEVEVQALCAALKSVLVEDPNVIMVNGPAVIVGDLHGQFEDLLSMLQTTKAAGADPSKRHFVFLGDYVDRGAYSLKTFLLLATLRLVYHPNITLLRGNHETRTVTQVYGFYDECLTEYGNVTVWKECCTVFDLLPLAAIVDDRLFCVHGGLSPSMKSLKQIRQLNRNIEPPQEGLFADLLWSDPDEDNDQYSLNARGAGYLFGVTAAREFLHTNRLSNIVRSHQLVMEGYKAHYNGRESQTYVATVWSAPNYCYRCGNKATVLLVDSRARSGGPPGEVLPFSARSDPNQANSALDSRKPDLMRFFV